MSDTTKRHNGWANYETWAVALWIGNEQGSYDYWREATQEAWEEEDGTDDRASAAAFRLANRLKEEIEVAAQEWADGDGARPRPACLYNDLLSAALSEVDWVEIARNWIDDIDE